MILVLLSNLYLGLGELIAKPCGLGLVVLIKLVNSLLLFLSGFGVCGNVAPTFVYEGIEYFLCFGLEGRGLCVVNL